MTKNTHQDRPAPERTALKRFHLFGAERLGRVVKRMLAEMDFDGALAVERSRPLPAEILLQSASGLPLPGELQENWPDYEDLRRHFESSLFSKPVHLVALWLPAEIEGRLWRHREKGYLLSEPADKQVGWTAEQRQRLSEQFEPQTRPTVAKFKELFTRLVRCLQEEYDARVVVFNASSLDPADGVHDYGGIEETAVLRTHRLNYALYEISAETGLAIVDVDRIVAELGGEGHVRGLFDYDDQLLEHIGREFVRTVSDMGLLSEKGLRRLILPNVGRQFESGTIVTWHKAEGDRVAYGDDLFDLRVDEISRTMRTGRTGKIETYKKTSRRWTWIVRISSAGEGTLGKISIPENGACRPDEVVAAIMHGDSEIEGLDEKALLAAQPFQVVANRIEK